MIQEAIPYPPAWVPPPSDDELVFDDGEPMESQKHHEQMVLLIELLRRAFSGLGQRAYVQGNMFVYFSDLQVRGGWSFRGPDVFAVLDVEERIRKGWVAWKEGGRLPDLVIELLSDSTRAIDRGEKLRIYERTWRVEDYILFDPITGELEGYHRGSGGFEATEPDAGGRLHLRCAPFSLGIVEQPYSYDDSKSPWLRVYDSEGALVPTTAELAASAGAQAKLESARAESESARAESESARAESESARAESESARAEELASRLAAYEARYGELEE